MSEMNPSLKNLVDVNVLDVLRSPDRFVDFRHSVNPVSDEQRQCLESVENFIKNDGQVFILTGQAGTGKSYLIPKIGNMAQQIGLNVVVCAPTGQAAKRLRAKGIPAVTVHSALYGEPEYSQPPTEEKPPTYWFRLRGLGTNCLFIVDESSMIGDMEYTEEERKNADVLFENGNLMSDLLRNVTDIKSSNKIIFVGDRFQLDPANGSQSLCLDPKYLKSRGLVVDEFALSEIHRTTENSQIRRVAQFCGQGGGRLDRIPAQFQKVNEVEKSSSFAELTSKYKEDFATGNAIAVVATNQRVDAFNDVVRSAIYGKDAHARDATVQVRVGDRMVAIRGCLFLNMLSGDEFLVEEVYDGDLEIVSGPPGLKPLHLQKIRASVEESGVKYEFYTFLVLESLTKSRVESEITRILWVNYLIRMRKENINASVYLAAETISADGFFNALRCTFSYARTCNKAQGGEWPIVITDATEWQSSNQKWGYTSVTRAARHLIVLTRFLDQKDIAESDSLELQGLAESSGSDAQELTSVILNRLSKIGFVSEVVQYLEHGFQLGISKSDENELRVYLNVYMKKGRPSSVVRTRGKWDSTLKTKFASAEIEVKEWIDQYGRERIEVPNHLVLELNRIAEKANKFLQSKFTWEITGPYSIRLLLSKENEVASINYAFGLNSKGLTKEQPGEYLNRDPELVAKLRELAETKGI